MAPVCAACNALFSGGDGITCPACDTVLAAPATHARPAPSSHAATAHLAPAMTERGASPSQEAGAVTGRHSIGYTATARPGPGQASTGRVGHSNAPLAPVWTVLVVAAAALVPLSSYLGVRGWTGEWLWIWKPSMLANVVFTAGTMGAFLASVHLVRKILQPATAVVAAVGIGLLLHWLVYEVSWRLVLAADPSTDQLGIEAIFTGVGFVAWVGGAGLLVAALTGGVAALVVRQSEGTHAGP